MSPRTSAGWRLLPRMRRSMSGNGRPASRILIGGVDTPFWYIPVPLAGGGPAVVPPTTALVGDRAGKGDDLVPGETRRDEGHVGDVRQTAFIGVIGDEHVAVADAVFGVGAVDREDAADQVAIDRRMEEHRRRDDQPAVAVQ